MKSFKYFRWFLLGLGIVLVIGLTAMNVYSLIALHENTIQHAAENQKAQLQEFTNQVRSRVRYPFRELRRLDINDMQAGFEDPSNMSGDLMDILSNVVQDEIFSGIYFTTPDCPACFNANKPLWKFSAVDSRLRKTLDYPGQVIDGIILAKTRMNTAIGEYRWNTRLFFDAHHSMTIVFIHPLDRKMIGLLTFMIDRPYLVEEYIAPKILMDFGKSENSGIIVWLHDWTKDEILASTHPDTVFSRRKVDVIQNFPDLLSDWNLKATFIENPAISVSQSTLIRNLFVLAGVLVLLIGTLIYMFLTAQKERTLARRQALFLANVTHELKTPLSVIQAAGENLSDGKITDSGRLQSYGEHIFQESIRLRIMIDQLLDVARNNSEKKLSHGQLHHLSSIVESFLNKKQPYLESRGFTVVKKISTHDTQVCVNPDEIFTILNNLTDNAEKYSHNEKYVEFLVFSDRKKVILEIIDRGIGIDQHSQKYIFEPFFRVEDEFTAHTKGHGLGLSIVRNLVKRNGGSVQVYSSPEKGSTFRLVFHYSGSSENNSSMSNRESLTPKNSTYVST